jgi:hypothetical protein
MRFGQVRSRSQGPDRDERVRDARPMNDDPDPFGVGPVPDLDSQSSRNQVVDVDGDEARIEGGLGKMTIRHDGTRKV